MDIVKPKPRTDTELLEGVIAHYFHLSYQMTWPHEPKAYICVECSRTITPTCTDPREAIGWAIDWHEGDTARRAEIEEAIVQQWRERSR